MLWLILSLFSAILESSRDLVSKKASKHLDTSLLAFSRSFFTVPFLLPFLVLKKIPRLDINFWFIVVLDGSLLSFAFILYKCCSDTNSYTKPKREKGSELRLDYKCKLLCIYIRVPL